VSRKEEVKEKKGEPKKKIHFTTMQQQPLDMSLLHFHLNKVMLQHEVPRYFPLQPEQSRKETKAKVSAATGAGIKAGGAGLNREAEKSKAAQPDYSH
jgi:AAA15 family ATPase/GTPase